MKTTEMEKIKAKYRINRTVLVLVLAVALTVAVAVPLVSAKYTAQLNLLANTGVDGVTNKDLIDALWPIGSVYMNADGSDPNVMFAGTTWVPYAQGEVIVGVKPGDANFDAGKSGGAVGGGSTPVTVSLPAQTVTGSIPFTACSTTWTPGSYSTAGASITGNAVSLSSGTVTVNNTGNILTGAPSITNAAHQLTIAQMPSHTHTVDHRRGYFTVGTSGTSRTCLAWGTEPEVWANYWTTNATGGDGSHTHNNTVGVGTLATSSHTHTASVGTATNHNATGSHGVVWPTHTDPTFSHTPAAIGTPNLSVPAQSVDVTVTDNTLQPYITCHMWKRTG